MSISENLNKIKKTIPENGNSRSRFKTKPNSDLQEAYERRVSVIFGENTSAKK